MDAIEVTNLVKKFSDLVAVDNVSSPDECEAI